MKKLLVSPFFWGVAILGVCQAVALALGVQEKAYLEQYQVDVPQATVPIALGYFAASVGVITVVLLLLPVRWLKLVLKIMFMISFGWGVFVALFFITPLVPAIVIAAAAAVGWFITPRAWLHNTVLALTLVGASLVFGFVFSPWVFIAFMAVIALYDFLAVRFGFMVWMAGRLSETSTLPAFFMPRTLRGWGRSITDYNFSQAAKEEREERDFAVLGGGDIGFPLILAVSTLSSRGLAGAMIVAIFSLLGVGLAFWIQIKFLKGRPMPALPPITAASVIGFLIVQIAQI